MTFINKLVKDRLTFLLFCLFLFLFLFAEELDEFVASSFGSTFTEGSILVFLVFGPMIDIKNTLMVFGYF